jgi:hypothetical protein
MSKTLDKTLFNIWDSKYTKRIRKFVIFMAKYIWDLCKGIWYIYTAIYEPVFLGSVLYLVYNQIPVIIKYSQDNPHTTYLEVFEYEMNTSSYLFYIAFATLLLFVLIKWIDKRHDDELKDSIKELIREIKENKEGTKNGKTKSSNNPKHRSRL